MNARLAITMGDVAGIGPEIIAKALTRPEVYERCRPLVIGDAQVMQDALELVGRGDTRVHRINDPDEGNYGQGAIDVYQPEDVMGKVPLGRISSIAGAASVAFIRGAARLAQNGQIDGIVTAPLNKEAMHKAGFTYPGHTEMLAELFDVEHFSLVLAAEHLYLFHVTTHVALRQACDLVTKERTLATIRLAHVFAHVMGKEGDTIAVTGLNPHASEGGLFGQEDLTEVEPAVNLAQQEGIRVVGPLPADALLPQAVRGRYSLVLVCYHDQGHAAFKAVYGDRGINITAGLPIVRTSVDHGTAFDIAGKGIAREDSLMEAIDKAVILAPRWLEIYELMREFSSAEIEPG